MEKKKQIAIKILISLIMLLICAFIGAYILLITMLSGNSNLFVFLLVFSIPSGLLYLIWKFSKKALGVYGALIGVLVLGIVITFGIKEYNKSLIINTTPNIITSEYLPFKEESKIVKLESEFKLDGELPRIDGAAAVFPVYSAFVNSVYPSTTELYDGVFEYNNTVGGYKLLGEKGIDIFFGAYPSKEQIETAKSKGTEFEYIPIGYEAFVFFVHKDNPIKNLTTEQIKGIYSGEITNWKEVGGKDEKIVAFQRNEGSGSQSMLKRFMGDTEIMEAPSEQVNDLMSGIIEKVADYRSTTSSIGFSFRYYVEGIIKNPDIKIVSIDGVYPSRENIQNESYCIVAPLYAVTYKDRDNENIDKFIEWILSEEGQYIISETGYIPVN